MLYSFFAILMYGAIVFFQIPQLKKEKMKKEIWIFSLLMVFVTFITIVKFTGMGLPNPLDLISIVFAPFSNLSL